MAKKTLNRKTSSKSAKPNSYAQGGTINPEDLYNPKNVYMGYDALAMRYGGKIKAEGGASAGYPYSTMIEDPNSIIQDPELLELGNSPYGNYNPYDLGTSTENPFKTPQLEMQETNPTEQFPKGVKQNNPMNTANAVGGVFQAAGQLGQGLSPSGSKFGRAMEKGNAFGKAAEPLKALDMVVPGLGTGLQIGAQVVGMITGGIQAKNEDADLERMEKTNRFLDKYQNMNFDQMNQGNYFAQEGTNVQQQYSINEEDALIQDIFMEFEQVLMGDQSVNSAPSSPQNLKCGGKVKRLKANDGTNVPLNPANVESLPENWQDRMVAKPTYTPPSQVNIEGMSPEVLQQLNNNMNFTSEQLYYLRDSESRKDIQPVLSAKDSLSGQPIYQRQGGKYIPLNQQQYPAALSLLKQRGGTVPQYYDGGKVKKVMASNGNSVSVSPDDNIRLNPETNEPYDLPQSQNEVNRLLKYQHDFYQNTPRQEWMKTVGNPLGYNASQEYYDDRYRNLRIDEVSKRLLKDTKQGWSKAKKAAQYESLSPEEREFISQSSYAPKLEKLESFGANKRLKEIAKLPIKEQVKLIPEIEDLYSKAGRFPRIPKLINPASYIGDLSPVGALMEGNYGEAAAKAAATMAMGAIGGGAKGNLLPLGGMEAEVAEQVGKRLVKPKVNPILETTPSSWSLQELPGLHLKSTMEGGTLEQLARRSKTGEIDVEQALAIIGKESGGADKVTLIKQGLGDNIPKKMDYNEFRKTVQNQLIPLEVKINPTGRSEYGLERIGYYDEPPMDRGALTLSNKDKFGRGSSAHGNPDETLGHIHFLRDAETPDVLTVTQIQSDAFQSSNHYLSRAKSKLEYHKKSLDESLKDIESIENFGAEDYERMIINPRKQWIKESEKEVAEVLGLNPAQKQLLDKNHQERYLQELVDYAGKRGDVNKVRVPTSETAAKVQGYQKGNPPQEFINSQTKLRQEIVDVLEKYGENSIEFKQLSNKYNKLLKDNSLGGYSKEHQTILKKYSEQPKLIKKLFGVEPKIVTDNKGNTWYEFDIPKKFKEGKGEIKAFSVAPLIGLGTIGAASTSNNSNVPEMRKGGLVNPKKRKQELLEQEIFEDFDNFLSAAMKKK